MADYAEPDAVAVVGKPTPKKDGGGADFMVTARSRFNQAIEANGENRVSEVEDLKFAAGSSDNGFQWPEKIRNMRENDPNGARPVLTINKLPQHIKLVTNEQRQNRPSVKVIPVDDKGDPEVAKILDGIVRHIEVNSDADVAYDTACENQVTIGEGYFRILTDYLDENSFEQDILIKRIRNSFSVYMDPNIQDPSGADQKWCFITDELSKDEFKAQYPKAQVSDWELEGQGDQYRSWFENDRIRIAEYFCFEETEKTIYLMEDGSVVDVVPEGMVSVKERKTKVPKVCWYKINGCEVLEKRDWAGKYIPVVRVVGNEFDIEGKLIISGIVRNAKDAQRMYNYWTSTEAEAIALAPKSPFVGAAGQFENYEDKWQSANIKNYAYLEYNPIDINGHPVPPPQRQMPPMVQAGIVAAKNAAAGDIQATVGQYNPSLGAEAQEKSGVAIRARQRQADVGTFHYVDNLSRAIRHCGRILLDLIPKIYDTQRVARILGEDGEPDHAKINPEQQVPVQDEMGEDGKAIGKIYNPGIGRYDVSVIVGPSYTTKRQEAVESMSQLLQGNPQLWGVVGDLFVKNMDWPGADEIAERIKKTIPPQLIEQDEGEGEVIQTPEGPIPVAQVPQILDGMKNNMMQMQEQLQSAETMGQQTKAMAEQTRNIDAQNKAKELELRGLEINEQELQRQAQQAMKDLQSAEQLAAVHLDMREAETKAAIRETMLKVEKMLSDHANAVEEMMEKPPEETTEPAPDVSAAILESTQMTAQAIQQMMQALVMPRTTELQMDEMGNPIGSISRVG